MNKLEVVDLKHSYKDGVAVKEVLKGVNAVFNSGTFYAILGESGSGKTTLLSLIAALDKVQSGKILIDREDLKDIGENEFRLKYSNVIFQAYNLIPYMTALENVMVAIDIQKLKLSKKEKIKLAYETLEKVGLSKEVADRRVTNLSGGEQQRTAIARSLIGEVPLILADEPTGNLDEETENIIIDIFKALAKEGKCVIVVTHSKNIADKADKRYLIKNGVMEFQN